MRWPTPLTGPAGAGITNTAPRPATTPTTELGSHDQRSTTAVLTVQQTLPLGPIYHRFLAPEPLRCTDSSWPGANGPAARTGKSWTGEKHSATTWGIVLPGALSLIGRKREGRSPREWLH